MDQDFDIKNLLREDKIRMFPLSMDYEFKPFDCGNSDLNDFLLNDSKTYLQHLRYTTTIFESEDKIVAYFSLANDLLKIDNREDFAEDMDEEDNHIQPDYWHTFLEQMMYPAAKIGRLAVHKDFQCNKIGDFIIDYLIYSFTHNNKTGCQFLTLDALNEKDQRAIRFYERKQFKFLTVNDVGKESRAMYLSLIRYKE